MDYPIILVYCLCANLLKALGHKEDPQCQLSDAEVMTTGLVAALFFGGKHKLACAMLQEQMYMPGMLSKSQFSRRLDYLFITLFQVLGERFKELNEESVYIIDSAPRLEGNRICNSIRIRCNKIYDDEAHRGYQASKRRYFYGIKIHLLVTKDHQPVEFFLSPGGFSDIDAAGTPSGCSSTSIYQKVRKFLRTKPTSIIWSKISWTRPISNSHLTARRIPNASCPRGCSSSYGTIAIRSRQRIFSLSVSCLSQFIPSRPKALN